MRYFFVILLTFLKIAATFAQELPSNENKFKFIENKGQWPEFVFFRAESPLGKMYVEQGRILYQFLDAKGLHHAHFSEVETVPELRQELLIANFVGAQLVNKVEKSQPSKEYYNFFIGQDQSKWASHVYGYADVVLEDIYPNINLHLNNEGQYLKYEFVVKSNGDPEQIQIRYDNARLVEITKYGGLRVEGQLGVIEETKPFVYQIKNGRIIEVHSQFVVENNTVSFQLGQYDNSLDLIIDPTMIFASYSGSISDNFGMTATYDNDGRLYSGGIVFGNSYPTSAGAYDQFGNFTQVNSSANHGLVYGVTDIFISKYSSDGLTMEYSTYLGGGTDFGGVEVVHSIICNEQNELYLFGTTSSSDFPLVNAVQSTFNGGIYREFTSNGTHFWGSDGSQVSGGTDLIVAKFSHDGSELLSSTYVGGSANDGLNYNETGLVNGNIYGGLMYNYGDPFRGEIMLDDIGNCYVVSCTYSPDFPLVNPVQSSFGGELDGVIMKFTPDLSNLLWSSYWGGSGHDACYSIKFNDVGDIYVAGGTRSDNFFTTNEAVQTGHNNTSEADGFVTRFSSDVSGVLQSTLLGTTLYDQAYFLQVDRFNKVHVLGQTRGNLTPSSNTFNNPNSGQFIMRLNDELSIIELQTVFGNGNGLVNISPTAFLVDICGNVYVSGWGAGIAGSLHQTTPLSGMPVTPNAFQSTSGDGYNFYLIVLSRNMEGILYGSYLGGGQAREHVDGGTSRFDKKGIVYHSACGGCGGYSDFPTMPSDVWSLTNQSTNCNNLVFKFDIEIIPRANFTLNQIDGCAPLLVEFENNSSSSTNYLWDFGNGDTTSVIFNPTMVYTEPGIYEVYLYVTDSICLLMDTAMLTITVLDSIQLNVPANLELCSPTELSFTANSFGTASYFIWSSNSDFTDTLNVSVSDSMLTITPSGTTTYYILAGNPACSFIDSVTVTFISSSLSLSGDATICLTESTTITATNLNPSITFDYQWSPSGIIIGPSNGSQVQVSPPSTQYLYVTASASNGCLIEDSILIQVSTIPDGSVIASATEYTIPQGGTTTLIASPDGYTYSWIPNSSLVSPNSQQTEAQVYENTVFILSVTDGICIRYDTVAIKVYTFICDEPFVYVPNAFTPNGDGENDVLYVRGPLIEGMVFRVFDRWGEMVFESFDRLDGWDGTFRGKALDPDVYDFYLQAICIDGEEGIIKGNVTLMR